MTMMINCRTAKKTVRNDEEDKEMINVLIATTPDDSHAIYTKLALEKKGCHPIMWYTADFPILQTHTFEITDDYFIWDSNGCDFNIKNDQFDVVWYRRPKKPSISSIIHHKDLKNSQLENTMLYQTFWEVISTSARWINPVKNARAANCKLLQLKTASELGLKIPPTLLTNDPSKIKSFINLYGDGNVIYKTLHPLHWLNDGTLRLTYTNKLKLEDLPEEEVLQSTAGIFQQAIEKAYELRVTYFGETPIAVKIDSQMHSQAKMDWRAAPIHELLITEYELPIEIDMKCRKLMKTLGLVFGCFDFIKTPDNDFIFLEINESGQFLWIEDMNPKIKMLDMFTDFILDNQPSFKRPKTTGEISINDLHEEALEYFEKNIKTHHNTHILTES